MYTLEQLRAWQAYTQTQQGTHAVTHEQFINLLMREFGCTHAQARSILNSLLELDYK